MAGAKGEAERAARLWGAAQTLHETKGIPRDTDFLAEADARISAVRSGMGEQAWEEAWRKGRAMTLDEAVSYALGGRGRRLISLRCGCELKRLYCMRTPKRPSASTSAST